MNKKLLIYYFFNLVWYRHPWSIIRDHGLVSTPLFYYWRPFFFLVGIRHWSEIIDHMVWSESLQDSNLQTETKQLV